MYRTEPLPRPVPAWCSYPSPTSLSPFPLLLKFHQPNSFLWLKTSTEVERPSSISPGFYTHPVLTPLSVLCPCTMRPMNSGIYIPSNHAAFQTLLTVCLPSIISTETQKDRSGMQASGEAPRLLLLCSITMVASTPIAGPPLPKTTSCAPAVTFLA